MREHQGMNSATQSAMNKPLAELSLTPGGLDPELAWAQLLRRDPAATFFYAVTTTGVVCRPACRSRLPLRANVRFFTTLQQARAAGFRPCLRCRPETPPRNALEKSVHTLKAISTSPFASQSLAGSPA